MVMSSPVRIPADINRPDPLIGNLTGRQLVIVGGAGSVVYLLWAATRAWLPLTALALLTLPILAIAAVVALGHRDGLELDRLLLAAVRQRLAPRYQAAQPGGVAAPPPWLAARATPGLPAGGRGGFGPSSLPARQVTRTASVDLGGDGVAMAAVCSTVNFALRSQAEQHALIGVFGRWLDSLTGPTQILIRAQRLDLSAAINELADAATGLAHPALRAAAVAHAEHLAELGASAELLTRQVLLVVREPAAAPPGAATLGSPLALRSPLAAVGRRRRAMPVQPGELDAARWAAENRLARRLTEAGALLAPAGITVHVLTGAQTHALLAETCNPGRLTPPTATTSHPTIAYPPAEYTEEQRRPAQVVATR